MNFNFKGELKKIELIKNYCLDSNYTILSVTVLTVVFNIFSIFFGKLECTQFLLGNAHHLLSTYLNENAFLSLIQILVGAFVGLIFFAMGVIGNSESGDMARVLLRKCYLRPLIGLFFGYTIIVLTEQSLLFTSMLSLLLIFLFIISFSTLIRLISDKRFFYKERENLLIERVKRELNLAVSILSEQRAVKNKLTSETNDGDILLCYKQYLDKKDKYIHFSADKSGTIREINVDSLQKFSEELERFANKKDIFFKKFYDIKTSEDGQEYNVGNKNINEKRFLRKLQDDPVDIGEPLISIDKAIVSTQECNILKKHIKKIFLINNSTSVSNELKTEINCLHQEFFMAIDKGCTLKLNLYKETYLKLADSFLAIQYFRESIYSSHIMDWFYDSLVSLIGKSMKLSNWDIIKEVIRIPTTIAQKAIVSNDSFIFDRFIELNNLLYLDYKNQIDERIRKILIDRSHRYITEAYIFSDAENKDKFATDILRVNFQWLLKESLERREFDVFKEFYDSLGYISTNRDDLNAGIVDKELDVKKIEMLFGIASLIVMKILEGNKQNSSELAEYWALIKNITNSFDEVRPPSWANMTKSQIKLIC